MCSVLQHKERVAEANLSKQNSKQDQMIKF